MCRRPSSLHLLHVCCQHLVFGRFANHAKAAVITYNFDVNGARSPRAISALPPVAPTTGTIPPTAAFGATIRLRPPATLRPTVGCKETFRNSNPAGTPTYIVTVSNDEQVAGMFFSTAQFLTINAIGSGDLDIVAGLQGVLGSGSADVTINAPITGPGEIQPSNGGNIRLNGVNTYAGGTNLSSTSTLIHFNNSSSFGTNFINMGVAGFAPLLASGGATVTLPNNFTSSVSGAGINFAADAATPVVSTGTWTLGANNLVLRNNGDSTRLSLFPMRSAATRTSRSARIVAGPLSSAARISTRARRQSPDQASEAGTGTTRAQARRRGHDRQQQSSVVLAGGILDPDGFNQNMSSTTLGLEHFHRSSTIDYSAGASEVDFANSSAVDLDGQHSESAQLGFSIDKLRFGTDSTGLTAAQLAKIEFNGSGLGTAQLDPNGYVVVPEPSAIALLLLGVAGLASRHRGHLVV